MHSDTYSSQQIRRKRERGQRMAAARWAADKTRRLALAALSEKDPLRAPGRILQRVIVIGPDGSNATEIIRRDNTTPRQWAKLKRSVGL